MNNQTMFWKTFAIIMFLISIHGCMNRNTQGEWLPFQESYSSEKLGEKYDVPNISHIHNGLIFWEISPYINQAPYAFNWYGDTIRIWLPLGTEITEHQLKIEGFVGLYEQLDLLLDTTASSAIQMMADKHRNDGSVWLGHPSIFRIKYYPPDMQGSINLNNIERDGVQWIKDARKVRTMSNECLGVKEVE